MFERYERPTKIVCLGLAALLLWQISNLFLNVDPLANLKIPALPTLPGSTNEVAKGDHKDTNAVATAKTGTKGTNATISTNVVKGTNSVKGTNMVSGANATPNTNMVVTTNTTASMNIAVSTSVAASTNLTKGTNIAPSTNAVAKSTNAPSTNEVAKKDADASAKPGAAKKGKAAGGMPELPPGMTPEMLASLPPEVQAQIMSGGMSGGGPGGPRGGGGGMKKIELPTEVKAHVDKVIESEIFGAIPRPMPMMLLGISDQEAYLQATNGQSGPVKVGAEMGGIKLLRIGINRVLVETDGEKKELTLFGGAGSESLMPKPSSASSTNAASTNSPSTNAPAKRKAKQLAAASKDTTNQTISSKQKETP